MHVVRLTILPGLCSLSEAGRLAKSSWIVSYRCFSGVLFTEGKPSEARARNVVKCAAPKLLYHSVRDLLARCSTIQYKTTGAVVAPCVEISRGVKGNAAFSNLGLWVPLLKPGGLCSEAACRLFSSGCRC